MNTTPVKTILLVEDEAIIAMSQEEILIRYGFEVVIAYNAAQAIEAAESPQVDLVLMDIDLGADRMTGTEAAEQILKKRELPILFCTSHAEKEMVEKVKGITRYGYVLKNAGEFVLVESITMAFELFDAQIRLKEENEERKRAERALTESEALYRNLMENSIDAIYLLSEAGKVLNVNKVACGMIGYTREELLSLTIDDIDPNYPSRNFIEFWKDKPKGSTILFQTVHRSKEGRLFPVEVNGIFFRLNSTKYLYGVVRDLSESVKKERECEEHAEAFRMMAESSGAGIVILQDGRLCYVNETAAVMSGHTREKLLAFETGDLLQHIHPEDRERIAAAYADKVQNLALYAEEKRAFEPLEYRYVRDDGRIVWTEIFASGIYHKGKPALFLICNDITTRRESLEELKRSEELYAAMFQGSRAVKLLIDGSDGRIIDANTAAADFYGYSLKQLTSMKISDLNILPEEQVKLEMQNALAGLVNHFFFKHRLADGRMRDVEVYSSPIRVHERVLLHSIIHDVTDRSAAEEQVRALVSEKEMLIKESHHRVKNNMLTLQSLLSLETRNLDDGLCKEPLKKVADRLTRMSILYDRLYRSEGASRVLVTEFLPSLVDEIVQAVQTDVPVRAAVTADRFSLDQQVLSSIGIIINELISNSVKYAFGGLAEGCIDICVEKRDLTVQIVYADNGRGLPEAVNLEDSTGFGMRLIGMMLKQLRGTAVITRGGGTRFEISIPL